MVAKREGEFLTRLSTVRQQPKYSFGSRFQGKEKVPEPGPGYYHSEQVVTSKSAPRALFLGHHELKITSEGTPGPGAYNYSPQAGSRMRSVVVGAFPHASRSHGTADATPGPGEYEPNSSFSLKAAPQVHMLGKHRFFTDSMYVTPGPGAYEAKSPIFGSAPSIGSGVGRRPTTGISFKGRPAMSTGKLQDTPGPGAYDGKQVSSGKKGFSMGGRHEKKVTAGNDFMPSVYTQFGY